MFRLSLSLLVLLYASSLPLVRGVQEKSAEKKPELKTLLETWQAAYFDGLKVGHMHTLSREVMRDGKKVIRTVNEMNLVLKRYGSVVPIRFDQISEETAEGKVLSLVSEQYIAKDTKVTLKGVIKAGKLTYTGADGGEQTL